MAKGRQVTIQFLGDSRSFTNATGAMGRSTTSLSDKLKRVGKAALIGFAGAAVVAGKAAYEMAEAAIEDEKSAALLARTLKNTTGATKNQVAAVEDWISKQGELYGITDDELRPALAKLSTVTGSITKSQKLAALAMDVSAGTGKDLASITLALAKAQTGSLAGLGRLGIATKDAAGETKTLAEITDDLAQKYKGAASTAADTASGKFQRLKVEMSELGESIGYKLLPYANDFGDWLLKDGVPAAEDFAHSVKQELGPVLKDAAGWVRDNKDEFVDLGKEIVGVAVPAIRSVGGVVSGAVKAFSGLPGPVKKFGIEIAIAAYALPKLNAAMGAMKLQSFITGIGTAETRMKTFGAAAKAAAGVGGMVAIVDGAQRSNKAIGALESTLGAAAVGFSAGGPIGAGVGFVGGLFVNLALAEDDARAAGKKAYRQLAAIDPVKEAKGELSDLRDTLDEVTGAFTGATRAAVLHKLEEAGLVDVAAKYGISAREVVDAALGQKGAMSGLGPVIADVKAQIEAADEAQGALARNFDNFDDDGFTKEAQAKYNALEKQKKELAANLEELKQMPGALKKMSRETRENAAATADYTGKLKGLPKQLVTAIMQTGVEPSARAIADLAKKYNLTPKQVKTLIKATGADVSAKQVQNLIDKIKALHDKDVTITTIYAHQGRPNDVNSGGAGRSSTGRDGNVIPGNFGGKPGYAEALIDSYTGAGKRAEVAGNGLLNSIVRGLKKGERTLKNVMKGLQDYIQTKTDKLNEILGDRDSFVQSFRDAFSESIFSAQFTDAEGNAVPPTLQKLMEFAKKQQENAHTLSANIKALISKGLSRDLIAQMVGQGQSGYDQIAALATGSQSDIDEFNAVNADIKKTLDDLGMGIWETLNPEKNGQIKLLTEQIAVATESRDALNRIAGSLDKDDEIKIKGTDLVILLRHIEKATGKQLLVTPA